MTHRMVATNVVRIGFASILVLAACSAVPVVVDQAGGQGGVVVTTGPPPPPANLGPAPEEIPANPRRVIALLPGGEPSEVHLEFMEGQPGYVEGSGRLEAIYPGESGPMAILTWESAGEVRPRIGPTGPQRCDAVVAVGGEPEGWGCGSTDSLEPDQPRMGGMSYTTEESGTNMVQVSHTAGADATVVELTDGSVFVIRPGESSISYHEWNGARPARVTVFWPDGASESQLTNP